jgi:drug/metabolite transporter (DMT)-like permease
MWLVCALLAAVLWGLNYTLTEKILRYIAPTTLLAFEMLIGAICFLIISYFTNLKQDVTTLMSQSAILKITILEIIVVILANFLIVYSIHAKNATVAGIIEIIYPLFTILFTWLIFQESHLNIPVLLGGGLILLGVFIISFA